MLTIHLTATFFAHHGLWEEERVLGNEFEVNVTVKHSPKKMPVVELGDTIDYIAVYDVVKQGMETPTPLLETLATGIAREILEKCLLAEQVNVSIRKLHPPVAQYSGNLGVSFEMTRSEL